MLVPPAKPDPTWAEDLAGSLREPKFPVSMLEAFGRRLRRNYLWIYFILDGAWALKSYIHPGPPANWAEFIDRSSFGFSPGPLMIGLGLIFNGGLIFLALVTARLKSAGGEDGIFRDPLD